MWATGPILCSASAPLQLLSMSHKAVMDASYVDHAFLLIYLARHQRSKAERRTRITITIKYLGTKGVSSLPLQLFILNADEKICLFLPLAMWWVLIDDMLNGSNGLSTNTGPSDAHTNIQSSEANTNTEPIGGHAGLAQNYFDIFRGATPDSLRSSIQDCTGGAKRGY
jgi:hypothetical protein